MVHTTVVKKLKPLDRILQEISFRIEHRCYIPNIEHMPLIDDQIIRYLGKAQNVEWPENSNIVRIDGLLFHKSWFEDLEDTLIQIKVFPDPDDPSKLDLTRLIGKKVYWRPKSVRDFSFEKVTKIVNTSMGIMITIESMYSSTYTRLMTEIDIAEITD